MNRLPGGDIFQLLESPRQAGSKSAGFPELGAKVLSVHAAPLPVDLLGPLVNQKVTFDRTEPT